MGAALQVDRIFIDVPTQAALAEKIKTCFGVGCPSRRTCLRYQTVDDAPGQSTTQVTCAMHSDEQQARYPDYLPIGIINLHCLGRCTN